MEQVVYSDDTYFAEAWQIEVLQDFCNVPATFSAFTSRTWNVLGMKALLSLFLERFYFAIFIAISEPSFATIFFIEYPLDIVSANVMKSFDT